MKEPEGHHGLDFAALERMFCGEDRGTISTTTSVATISRRRFLIGTSVLAGAASGASHLLNLACEHLSIYYSGDRLVTTLEHLVWTISIDQFAEGARLYCDAVDGSYTVRLVNAYLPGTGVALDFTARLERRFGRWYIVGVFEQFGVQFDVRLAKWLLGVADISGTLGSGQVSGIIAASGFSAANSSDEAQLTVNPRLGLRITTRGLFDVTAHCVSLSARILTLKSAPVSELKALTIRSAVRSGFGTRINLDDVRAVEDQLAVGLAEDGSRATLQGVNLATVRLEVAPGWRDTSALVVVGRGLLCLHDPDDNFEQLADLCCESFMVVVDTLRGRDALAVIAKVSNEPHLVRARQGAFIVTGRPGALVRIGSVGGQITHWMAEAQAESLSLPMCDVDIATLNFAHTHVLFRLEPSSGSAPSFPDAHLSSRRILDGEAHVIPAALADSSMKAPYSPGPTYPVASEEPRVIVGLNAEGGIDAPLDSASLRVLRARDLLDLSFGFRDLKLVVKGKEDPQLLPLLDGAAYEGVDLQRPLLIVTFPPQNLAQRAFLRQLNASDQPVASCGAGSTPLRYTVEIDRDKVEPKHMETLDEAVERTRGERDAIYRAIYDHFKALDAGKPGKLKWYNGGEGVGDAELKEAANVLGELIKSKEAFPVDNAVEARLSSPSRLVFEFPTDAKSQGDTEGKRSPEPAQRKIPFSIAGLTAWRQLRLVVVKRAMRPKLTLDEQMKHLGFRQTRDWRERMNDVVRSIVPPSQTETAIEAQIRLLLSPDEYAVWDTPRTMPPRGQPVPVWRSRLSPESRSSVRAIWSPDLYDGVFNCGGRPPEYGDDVPWPISEDEFAKDPYAKLLRLPLSVRDRHELVILTSVYGLPALAPREPEVVGENEARSSVVATPDDWLLFERGKDEPIADQGIYDPQPLKRAILALTSQGAHFRGDGAWEPPASVVLDDKTSIWPALSIERWKQLTFLGSDIEVEVAYKGYLFPCGVRASLVKRTETRYYCHARWHAPVCYSVQRMYCEVEEQPKSYPAVGQPDLGRDWPPNAFQCVTTRTPDLVDPFATTLPAQQIGNTEVYPGGRIDLKLAGRGLAFFPRVHACFGNEFKFGFKIPGESGEITLPLIFIDNTGTHDRQFVEKLAAFYRSLDGDLNEPDDHIQLRVARHTGERRRYAEVRRDGDTDFDSNWWLLNLRGRPHGLTEQETWHVDGVLEGADQPPFYPVVERAGVKIQSIDRLLGRVIPEIEVAYDQWYVRSGFDSARNPAEIYLNLLRPDVQFDVSRDGQKTAGVAKPNSRIVSLSRISGPVGGAATASVPEHSSRALVGRSTPSALLAVPQETAAARSNTFSGSEVFGGALKKAKLLGLINLEDIVKVAKYTDAAPKLVERFEYGMRGADDEIREQIRAVAGGIADEIQSLTDTADNALAAAFGEPAASHPFRRWYPDLGDALERLRVLLTKAMDDTDTTPVFERVTEIVEAGKVVLAEFDRVRHNPTPTVVADFIAEFQRQVDRIRNLASGALQAEIEQFLAHLVEAFNKALANLCGDLLREFTSRLFGSDFEKDCANIDVTKPETFEQLFYRLEDALYRETVGRAFLEATRAVGEVQQAARTEIAKLPEKILHAAEKALHATIQVDRVTAFVRGLNAGELSGLCAKAVGLVLDLTSEIVNLGEKDAAFGQSLSKRLEELNNKILEMPKGMVTPEATRAIDLLRAQLAQSLQRVAAICVQIQKQRMVLAEAGGACTDLSRITEPAQQLMRLRWQSIEYSRDLIQQIVDAVDSTLAAAWPPARVVMIPGEEKQKRLARLDDDRETLRLRLVELLELVTPIFHDLTSIAGVVAKQPFDIATVRSRVETIQRNYTPSYLADIEAQAQAVGARATKLEEDGRGIITELADIHQKLEANPADVAALDQLRTVRSKAVELFKETGLYCAEFDRKLTALALPMLAFADLTAEQVLQVHQQLEDRGRAIALAIASPLSKVHAEAADGLQQIKKLLDGSPLLNNIIGAQLRPLLDATDVVGDAALFNTLHLKASNPGTPFEDLMAAARAIEGNWRAQRPALLQKAEALASIVDALIHGNLSRIVDFGALERAIRDNLQQFLPTKVTLDYTFESDLNDFPSGTPAFSIRDASFGGADDFKVNKDLTIRTEVVIDLRDMSRTFRTRGLIKPFLINIPGAANPPAQLVSLLFTEAVFSASDSSSASFKVKVHEVQIGTILSYVQQLQAWMSPASGPYVKPIFDPLGIEAGFRLALPQIPVGPMQFVNIAFSIACVLPFDDQEARFRFSFCERQRPFLIVFPPYGGGGFAGFVASAKGIVGFEGSFEFGAVIPIAFGPLRANGRVTAGIYIWRAQDVATIEGFVQAVGEGSIGCFTIAVCLIVGVRSKNGNMEGYSTFSMSFKVGFAEISYSFTAQYKMAGSGSSARSVASRRRLLFVPKQAATCTDKPTLIIRNRTKYLSRADWKEYKGYFDLAAG